ncbi:MAG TPA: peptidoglycan DD-metalloendopeptidase family protein [Coleofasciculaceae cyanobacterium]|jgi:murein DD-endopeptidase MepM/ murein hydrolase activator NlpD
MSAQNDLISPKTDSDANIFCPPNSISTDTVKLANQKTFKLGMAISLAAAICVPNFNQAVHATNLVKSVAPSPLSHKKDIFNSIQRQKKFSSLLPNIFSRISFSLKSQLLNLSKAPLASEDKYASIDSTLASYSSSKVNKASDLFFASADFKTAKSEQVVMTAFDSSLIKPQQRIHKVVQGETINKIVKKYRVTKNDLVKLNKIKNSNIIFVDQQLKIPIKTAANTQPETILAAANFLQDTTQEVQSPLSSANFSVKLAKEASTGESSKTNKAELNSVTKYDPYIAKLRAEIDLLRAQHRNRSGQEQNHRSSLAKSPLAPNSEVTHQLEGNLNQPSQSIVKANSALSKPNLSASLLKEENISLKLPPLPASEEYLPPAFDGYMWPAQGVLTSGYGLRWGRFHRGIDIAAPIGTPVLAAASGEVIGAGWHDGYGNLIQIEHLDGSFTLYAHNDRILVSHGQKVNQGEQIAEMGSTGNSTGPHLHFEIHVKNSEIVDPLTLLSSK